MRKKMMVGVVLLLSAALAACAAKDPKPDNSKEEIVAYVEPISISKSGALNVDAYKVSYLDFATGSNIFVCNKEGCDHSTKECNADVFDIQAVAAFFHDGDIYMICRPDLEGLQLWRMNADGTDRKMLIEKMDGLFVTNIIPAGDKIYYSAEGMDLSDQSGGQVNESEHFGLVVEVDLAGNAAKTLWSGKEDECELEKLCLTDGKLFFKVIHYEVSSEEIHNKVFNDPSIPEEEKINKLIELSGERKINETIYSIDTADRNVTTEYQRESLHKTPMIIIDADARGILTRIVGDEYYIIRDGRAEKVYDDMENIRLAGDYLLSFDYENSVISVCDKENGEVKQRVEIVAPPDYFEEETETQSSEEQTEEMYGDENSQTEEKVWGLIDPQYIIDGNLFFNFSSYTKTNIWMIHVDDLAEGKCIWYRGIK